MSKNDEIVNKVIPEAPDYQSGDYCQGIDWARDLLKQALTEGKLVVPLKVWEMLDINEIAESSEHAEDCGLNDVREECTCFIKRICEAIYEAQFGGNK